MATVYLAHDLRHEREVAIKVLHPDLGAVLGSDRFLSEIKTTARLQHPHILPLLDSGAAEGLLYYVMPFVRGETLRARLVREQQIPIEDAVRIAREVADALGAAHALGIIHRDIKPENILLQDGHALVADFGIALAVQHAGGARMTQTGLSLGTPQYMSPEQAMGERAIDARTDQYALGVVTYEMLVGEPPFTGATVQAIIAKALNERPVAPSRIRDTVPPGVEAAVLKALAKLPADRFHGVREFAAALSGESVTGYATRPATAPSRMGAPVLIAALLGVVLGGAAVWLLVRSANPGASTAASLATRFVVEQSPGARYLVSTNKPFTVSPDGSTLVYAASISGRPQQLFRRRFDELESVAIPGTTGANDPVFSPDGTWLAFVSGAQLVKVPLEGGTPIQLATIPGSTARGVAWAGNGEIVFATNSSATLRAVPQDGGTAREVFRMTGTGGPRWPVAVPGSDELLFTSFSPAGDSVHVYAGSLKDGVATRVDPGAYNAIGLLDGNLIYVTRTGNVMAAPYDRRKRVTTGQSRRIASGVQMSTGTGLSFAVLSPAGDLVFRDGTNESQLVYADAQGRTRPALDDTLNYETPRFSPDGRRIAVSIGSYNRKAIWILDRSSGVRSRVSDEEDATTRDRPEWFPDGKRLVYRRNAAAGNQLVTRRADMSDAETPIPTPGAAVNELVVAPDGKTVLARVSSGIATTQDLWSWVLPDTVPRFVTQSPEFETGGRFSPDGHWVAYSSETGGIREVYVSPFPGPGGRVQVSREGGASPVWGPGGRTLYYPKGNQLLAATLTLGPSGVEVGGRRIVIEGNYDFDNALHAPFDVGPDGTILLVRPVREARTVVIRNFGAEIRNQLAKQGVK
jgi:eukaryotic-like serine/threonine-protein kinase